MFRDEPKIAEAFRSGKGVGWHEHDHVPFLRHRAVLPARLHRQSRQRLAAGPRRRRGEARARAPRSPTSAAATAPRRSSWRRPSRTSHFLGFDYHDASIERGARGGRRSAGVGDRVAFEVAAAKDFPAPATISSRFFDCLHDMGDPAGAARARPPDARAGRHLDDRRALAPTTASRTTSTRSGGIYYAASTMICTPASLSQEVGLGLGAQAGESRLRQIVDRRRLHAASAGRPRRRSTWCWRPAASPASGNSPALRRLLTASSAADRRCRWSPSPCPRRAG